MSRTQTHERPSQEARSHSSREFSVTESQFLTLHPRQTDEAAGQGRAAVWPSQPLGNCEEERPSLFWRVTSWAALLGVWERRHVLRTGLSKQDTQWALNHCWRRPCGGASPVRQSLHWCHKDPAWLTVELHTVLVHLLTNQIIVVEENVFNNTFGCSMLNRCICTAEHIVHSESIQTPWRFPHFVTLQPYS